MTTSVYHTILSTTHTFFRPCKVRGFGILASTTPSDPTGRITTKEVWKLIGSLKDVIRHQTAAIENTQNELREIKHNQSVL